jgi:hypothetical protein
MSSALTAGDNLVTSGVRANFVRAKLISITGGRALLCKFWGRVFRLGG